jgi:hypothetical protein
MPESAGSIGLRVTSTTVSANLSAAQDGPDRSLTVGFGSAAGRGGGGFGGVGSTRLRGAC